MPFGKPPLESALSQEGAHSPGALAAWIGRKKYGKDQFQSLGARAKHAHAGMGQPPAIGPAPKTASSPWISMMKQV